MYRVFYAFVAAIVLTGLVLGCASSPGEKSTSMIRRTSGFPTGRFVHENPNIWAFEFGKGDTFVI